MSEDSMASSCNGVRLNDGDSSRDSLCPSCNEERLKDGDLEGSIGENAATLCCNDARRPAGEALGVSLEAGVAFVESRLSDEAGEPCAASGGPS